MLQPKNFILERQTKKEIPDEISRLYTKINDGLREVSKDINESEQFCTPKILKRYLQQDRIDLFPESSPKETPNSFNSNNIATFKVQGITLLDTEDKGKAAAIEMLRQKNNNDKIKIETFGKIIERYPDLLLQIRELHFRIHQYPLSDVSGLIDSLEQDGEQSFNTTEVVADVPLVENSLRKDSRNNESAGNMQEQIKHRGMLIKGYSQTIAGLLNRETIWSELDRDYQAEIVEFVSEKYLSLLQNEAISPQLEQTWNSIPPYLRIKDIEGNDTTITKLKLFTNWAEEFSRNNSRSTN